MYDSNGNQLSEDPNNNNAYDSEGNPIAAS